MNNEIRIAQLERRIDALEKRVFEMSPLADCISVQKMAQEAWAENNNQGAPKITDLTRREGFLK